VNEGFEGLFEEVREECSRELWSRGVELTRQGELRAHRSAEGVIEARVVDRTGVSTPLVTLSVARREWSCECPTPAAACDHVAAAVILLRRAATLGESPVREVSPEARLGYDLVRGERGIELHVVVVRGKERRRTTRSVAAIERSLGAERLAVRRSDLVLDDLLRGRRVGPLPKPLVRAIFDALRDVEDVTFDGKPVIIGEPAYALEIALTRAAPGSFRLAATAHEDLDEVFINGAARRGKVLFAVQSVDLSDHDLDVLRRGRTYEASEAHTLVSDVLPNLESRVPVRIRTNRLPKLTPMQPRFVFSVEQTDGKLSVTPDIVYGDPPSARLDGDRLVYLGEGPLPIRNLPAERAIASRLREKHFMRPGVAAEVEPSHAPELLRELRALGGASDGPEPDTLFVAPELTPFLSDDEDEIRLAFRSEGKGRTHTATARSVIAAWESGTRLVALDAGGWAPLPANFLEQYGHLVADLLAASDQTDALPRSAGADIAQLYGALNRPVPTDLAKLRALADGFSGVPRYAVPDDVRAELREYQRDGVDWLAFLSKQDLGGLLADDMGLGKTLQAMCVMGTPTLVVCPSSVLHAWHDEIDRFRPGLKVHRYHGLGRQLDPSADVTLTTYAILRRDSELLAQVEWDTAILDEAQHIKNPESQVAQSAYRLRARFRMALTGTPVENHLEDLWSQIHYLNPGLLGGLENFRRRYARPIAAGETEQMARLRSRTRPFVLRRLKNDVAKELPPRTDVVLRCELDRAERAAYDAVRAATREEVVRELSAGRNVLAALEALLRLRQACCHRGLLPGHEAESSSKVELLMETLGEVLEEGHRALVFSQWTSLLDRVEPHLERTGVRFSRLDGSTRDRAHVVREFQSENGPPVMLISLKAGGTGLTLTRADHVFLLDPWWNPAVEDQAADRTHRIGQDRPVFVHRLVATDTVEEGLLELQTRKRALADAALGAGAAEGGSGLTRQDLLALLER
jgi:superfamily II DNA or RNA helicase